MEWGDSLKDFLEYMEMVSDGAMTRKIQALEGLMSRQPIGRKRGPIDDKISKSLVYGDQQMPETQIKIGEIKAIVKVFRKTTERKDGL